MKLKQLLILLVLVNHCGLGQARPNDFKFIPDKPIVNQPIAFHYHPTSFAFTNKVSCLAYFSGDNQYPDAVKIDFPKVVEVILKKSVDGWHGQVDSIPKHSTAIIVVFFDSLSKKDNNSGKGYWSPLYFNSNPVPGALSGLATMLYGNANSNVNHFNLKLDLNIARELYEKDFELNPEIKRKFIRQYIATLDFNTEDDKNRFKSELNNYASYSDLSEWDLKAISENYDRINDTLLAKKFNKLIFEKFPHGSWAMQTNSLKMLINIGAGKNFEKQKAIYGEFKKSFTKSFPDEFTRRVMSGRRGRMLAYMARFYANEGVIPVWEKEVDELDDEFRSYAYRDAARYILDYVQSEQKKENAVKNTPTESSLFVYNLTEENVLSSVAETLARKSTNLWEQNLNAPRSYIDSPDLTDEQVKNFRQERLGDFLDIVARSLIMQNKFEEAMIVLNEAAVKTTKRKNSTINEHYVESLVRAGKLNEAVTEIETLFSLGKSTEKIDGIYAKLKKNEGNSASLKDDVFKSTESRVREMLISENAPDFNFYDLNGNVVSSQLYKNKIIVIDFWASWCPPCMIGIKSMEQAADKYKGDANVVFLVLNVEKTKTRALDIINSKKNKSSFAFDSDREVSGKYRVGSLPTKIIIDTKGRIRFRKVGITTYNVQEQVDELLAMLKVIEND